MTRPTTARPVLNLIGACEMERLIRDGKVAVLVSPGFGAGWSTWAPEDAQEARLFDPGLVELILNDSTQDEINSYVAERFPDQYRGGVEQLRVFWVPEGTKFRIHEYDGSESLVTIDEEQWFTA